MATTWLTAAFAAVKAQLEADLTPATVVLVPFDIEPELVFESSASWPTESKVGIAVIDRGVDADDPARGEQKRLQREVAEIAVFMKAASLDALTTLFHSTRRQVFESMETVERNYPYSANRWTVLWQGGGSKASKANEGFQAVLRVDLLIEWSE